MVAPPEICPERTVLPPQHRPRSVPAASACACAGEGRPQQHRAYPGCTPHRAPCPTSSSAAAWRPPRRSALPRRRTTSPPRREISHLPTWEKQSAPFTSARFRSGRHTVRPVSAASLDGHPHTPLRCHTAKNREDKWKHNGSRPAGASSGQSQTQRVAAAWGDELLGSLRSPPSHVPPPARPPGRLWVVGGMGPSPRKHPQPPARAPPCSQRPAQRPACRVAGDRRTGGRGREGEARGRFVSRTKLPVSHRTRNVL